MSNFNYFWRPLDSLKNLVAASAQFQTVVGAVSPAAAKQHVYLAEAKEGTQPIPRAVVCQPVGQLKKIGGAQWKFNGVLGLMFEFAAASADRDASAETFLKSIETIIDDMKALAGTGSDWGNTGSTYLNVTEFNIANEALPFQIDKSGGAEGWWMVFDLQVN